EYLSDDFATGGAPTRLVKADRPRRGHRLYVILDPGHGGSDPGVVHGGLYEDELAYDIMLRLKNFLEQNSVTVMTTVRDASDNGQPKNLSRWSNGSMEYVKTTPPYRILDSRVSVNMRVYLVNSLYQQLKKRGISDRNIIFISLHMDHLHPSMRGAMIYYPNENLRRKSFKAHGRIYRKYLESKNVRLRFASREIRKAASFSYNFSRTLVRAFKRNKIPVHSYRPIRPFVYRKNRKWIPGVIRYSKVPTSVLIEVVNMANRHDLANIRNYRFRDRVARAIAQAIL
ncbi:MAG: N-acetylmuramoyl-L-alanine amidase, partial [Calditrichaeota bacterium]